jgi:Putative peptidoglycan binding domain
MRTFLVLICSFALACAAVGAQKEDKSKKAKKKQAQSTQQVAPGTRPGRSGPQKTTAHRASGPNSAKVGSTASYQKKTKGSQHVTRAGGPRVGDEAAQKTKQKTKGPQQGAYHDVQKTKKSKVSKTAGGAFQTSSKTYKSKHFNLQTKVRPATVAGVTFQQNRRIVGSQNWRGPNYTVFRTYTPVWHDRFWWGSHYNRIVFAFGGWYYWNAGWWYPAWGYAPNAYYAYDGPIYAYNDLPPDQVIANVQAALQEQGYYQAEVDGLLGPLTRAAIADYQRDHGLYITSAIDRPTLESLGMT